MTGRLSLPAIVAALLAAGTAHAAYISNYAAWRESSSESKQAYLAGVLDSWTRTSTPGEPDWFQAQRTGINKCLREQRIHTGMLMDLVEKHYTDFPADWRLHPAGVLKYVVMNTCLADVNEEREKAGYSPWARESGQMSKDK